MKVIPLTIALFFLSSLLFAQHEAKPIKIGEYERNGGGGCDEYFRFSSLLEEMARYPESRGLVIVYAGKGDGRFGNLTACVRGAQNYLSDVFKLEPNRVSFVIGSGKTLFREEFWLIPRGSRPPSVSRSSLSLERIASKYHFSYSCLQCEPSYPMLTGFQANFEDFAQTLNTRPELSGLIEVRNYGDLATVVRSLTQEKQLPRNRYKVRVIEATPHNDPNVPDLAVDLYLLPVSSFGRGISNLHRTSSTDEP